MIRKILVLLISVYTHKLINYDYQDNQKSENNQY